MAFAHRWILAGAATLLVGSACVAWYLSRPTEKEMAARPPFDETVAVTDPGSLFDRLGRPRRLSEFVSSRALLLVFLSSRLQNDDPALGDLWRLDKEYRDSPVTVLAVYPDEEDSIEFMAAHAVACDLPCLVLRDAGGRLAKLLGVENVPTFCVLAGNGTPRYLGPARHAEWGEELPKEALDAILAGDPVEIPWAPSGGLSRSRAEERPTPAVLSAPPGEPTYARDVAPITRKRCEPCHRANGMAPFALGDLENVLAQREMIEEVIETRRMPPWDADRRIGHFANDRDLSPEERATFLAWLRGSRLPGAGADPPPPLPQQDRWMMGTPDVLIAAPRAMEIPAEGVLEYQFVEIPAATTDPIFQEDRWVRAAEVLPSNPSVTHHVIVYAFPPNATLSVENLGAVVGTFGWVPGKPFFSFPPETALLFPKGCRLLVEMHYTPNGKATSDRPEIALSFSAEPPRRPLRVASITQESIAIPPRATHHPGQAVVECGADMLLWGVLPHMHARGKDIQLARQLPGASPEILLSVPKFNFYWQTAYWFAEPIRLPKGSRLICSGHWDNSALNLDNPDPEARVSFGMQTADEMLNAWVFVTAERPGTELPSLALLPTSIEEKTSVAATGGSAGSAGMTIRDFRLLEVLGSHARLEYPEEAKGLRIVPKSASAEQTHRIMLTSPDIAIERDGVYVLAFRSRADARRRFEVQVAQAHAPWENLGLQRALAATTDWNSFRMPFRASATDRQAWVAFFLGQDAAPIEIADFGLTRVPAGVSVDSVLGATWRLSQSEPVHAELRHPDPEFRVQRIELSATTGEGDRKPWLVRLEGPRTHLASGQTYLLSGRGRADRPRNMVAVVSQADPPHDNAGLYRNCPLSEEWRQFQFPFEATKDEDAIAGFFLGEDLAAVELADLALVAAPDLPWRLRTAESCLARLVPQATDSAAPVPEPAVPSVGNDASIKVAFSTPAPGNPWDVQLQYRALAVKNGQAYRVKFRARADRTRPGTLTMSAGVPPFQNLGLYRDLSLAPDWTEHSIEFNATGDEPNAVISFGLGQDDSPVEIADFVVE